MDDNVRLFLKSNNRTYDIWGHSIFVLMLISYTMYFLVRQNFAFAMPFIEGNLHFSKTELGTIVTFSSLTFGVGKLINGFLGHLLRPQVFLGGGLILSSIMNLVFPNITSLWALTLIWSLNSFFQSIAWPQCVRLMSEWYSPSQLGTRWGVLSTANQAGSFLIAAFLPFVMESYGWKASFIVPAIVGIISGLVILALPLEVPKALGLSSMEDRHVSAPAPHSPQSNSLSKMSLEIISEILGNKFLWYICFSFFFIYIVKNGFTTWAPTYLKEVKGLNLKESGFNMSLFDTSGALGGLTAGWVSDKIFKGKRGPVGVMYLSALIVLLSGIWLAPAHMPLLDIGLFVLLGFFFFGPQVMAGAASVDFSTKKAAVAANGFVGFFSYFGSSFVSGILFGYVTENYGWSAAFFILVFSAFMAMYFFAKTLSHPGKEKATPIKEEKETEKGVVNLS